MVTMSDQCRIVHPKSQKETVAYTEHSGDQLIGTSWIVQNWNVAGLELFGDFLAPFK